MATSVGVVSHVARFLQSRLTDDHCFQCVRLWLDMHAPSTHVFDHWATTTVVPTMWLGGSVLSASIFDDTLFPVRYRRFFCRLLSREWHLRPLSTHATTRFCANVHGESCVGTPSACIRTNIDILRCNVRYLMVLYARLFAIPMVLTIGRQLVRTSMSDSSGKRLLRHVGNNICEK